MRIWPRGMQHVSRPKYRATPTLVDGIRFPSKLEAARYRELRALQASGAVLWFIRQPSFDLGGGVRYVADFLVVWRNTVAMVAQGERLETPGAWVQVTVEDCKGVETAVFRVKKKLLEDRYPHVQLRLLTRKEVRV